MSTDRVAFFLLASWLVIANNTDMNKISFPEQLKRFRSQKNMTQDELGVAVGVSRFTILDWEAGKRTPTIDMLPKISEVLDVSIADLIDTGGDKRSEVVQRDTLKSLSVDNLDVGERRQEDSIVFRYTEKDRTAEVSLPKDIDPALMAVAIDRAAATVRGYPTTEHSETLVVKHAVGGDISGS